jgi:hypothetical protein
MIGRKPTSDLKNAGWISISISLAITAGFMFPLLSGYLPFINKPADRILCDGEVVTRSTSRPDGKGDSWSHICLENGTRRHITVPHYLLTGAMFAILTFILTGTFINLQNFLKPKKSVPPA